MNKKKVILIIIIIFLLFALIRFSFSNCNNKYEKLYIKSISYLFKKPTVYNINYKNGYNTHSLNYSMNGGLKKDEYKIFPVKQQFHYQGENIFILDNQNEITEILINFFNEQKLNWSFGYQGEAIKYSPTYIITDSDITEEKIEDLLNYSFINQIYVINSKFKNFKYNSKLYLIQISDTEDIYYGRNNAIFYTTKQNLNKLFNTFSFMNIGKSSSDTYYPEIFNKILLTKIKYLNIVTSLNALNNALNDWCKKKNKTLKLSELHFLGQGLCNVCIKIPNYNYLLRVSLKLSPSLDPTELNDDKIDFLKKFGPSPMVKFNDYNFIPNYCRWMEVEECKPIQPFVNFKDFTNYDKNKLKQLLIKAKRLFSHNATERKINNNYIDYYCWYDLNMGNIMIDKNGDYVIVDIDFALGKNWKLIDSHLETTLNKNITAYNLVGTKPLVDTETYTLLHYILKEHKYEYPNNKIIEFFLIKLNYLRFLENQQLDIKISNSNNTEEQIELKNKFNVITNEMIDNLINENFTILN